MTSPAQRGWPSKGPGTHSSGRTLALLCLLSGSTFAQDAGVGDFPLRAAGVAHGALVLDDGRALDVDGGVWLDDATALARAKDLERLAAENAELRKTPTAPPVTILLAVALAIGVGFVGGYFTPHP